MANMGSKVLGVKRLATPTLIVAALVMNMVALPAASVAASNKSARCQSTNDNSRDRLQRAGLDFCTAMVGQSIVVTAKAARFFYHWGTQWHPNRFPVEVTFSLFLDHIDARGLSARFAAEIWDAHTSSNSVENWMKVFAVSKRGIYRVTVLADVEGMFWSDAASVVQLVTEAHLRHYR